VSTRILLSFKDNDIDKKLLKHLMKYSEVIGTSSYIKQLLHEDMLKKNSSKEVEPNK
jgi:hypothetical protein